MAVLLGIALVNVASRKGWVKYSKMQTGTSRLAMQGIQNPDDRPVLGIQTVSGDSIDSFAWHLVVVGIACFIGLAIKECLIQISKSWA